METALTWWEGGFEKVVEWTPYVTLGIGLVLSVLRYTWPERLASAGLAPAAALWSFSCSPCVGTGETIGGCGSTSSGLLVFFAVLMFFHPIYFVFVITGFIHAFVLEPAAVAFVGVGLTSLLINSQIIANNPNADQWWTYGIIVVIQTVAVGFGIVGGEKISNLSEERRRSLLELETALEENAGLHAQLVAQAREAGITDERQRIAGEIHDTIAQGLTGVITQLEAANQVKSDPAELQRRLDNATNLARESLAEARRSMRAILPAPLEGRQLADAVADEAARWSSLNRVPTEVTTTGETQSLHPEVEVTVLRVAQEALANVAKHADASRVGVTLSYMGDIVTIDVKDNGTGFEIGNGTNGGEPTPGSGSPPCVSGSSVWPAPWRSSPSPEVGRRSAPPSPPSRIDPSHD